MNPEQLEAELSNLIKRTPDLIALDYLLRIARGKLTREEHPESHFCVYFAGYDPEYGTVFIGKHKKSGLWLFNGGHMEMADKTLQEAVLREMAEEWGFSFIQENLEPELLTITVIENPEKQTCQVHYDIWFFIKLNCEKFSPDDEAMSLEFNEYGFLGITEAGKLVADRSTIRALAYIKENLF